MDREKAPELVREVAFRFALDLNQGQERLAWQLAGSRRFVYNRLLDGVHARMEPACGRPSSGRSRGRRGGGASST